VPHLWRRQFCGLVRGLDRGVGRVVREARAALGEELLVVFTSDNGAAPWFGGLGAPFRGGKTTPFEQGLKVPSCVVDFGGRHWGRRHELTSVAAPLSQVCAKAAEAW
jgi:arylsulfatase A-like enzyme